MIWNHTLTQAEITADYNGGAGYNYFPMNITTPPPIQTVNLSNVVNTTPINSFCMNGTGTNTTITGICTTNGTIYVNTTGTYNLTFYNITNYFNTTFQNQAIAASGNYVYNTSQAYLNVSAYRLFINSGIASFNATNNKVFSTTSTGSILLSAVNGTNNIKVDVAGNYSKNFTCTVSTPLSTAVCNASGIHDNYYYFNATDIYNDVAIQNFSISISNVTLGGLLNSVNTTNGSINFSLIRGYNYLFSFSAPNGTFENMNVTLAANASSQRYEFQVLPTPSIDITIRDADDNSLILENITIRIIDNTSAQTNYTTTGGFFYVDVSPGVYDIELESGNYSESDYTITTSEGAVYYLTAYLQFAPNTVTMQFVDSISSSVALEGVAVSQQRLVNGSWAVVSSKTTDITGRTTFRYADDVEYKFSAILADYATKEFTLDPILFDTYTIKMIRTTALNFDQDFQSVYVGYNPKLFYDDRNNQVNVTFMSPLGTFTSYSYNISYPGGSKAGSGVNMVGETFTTNFNITGADYMDRVNITLAYDTSLGDEHRFNYSHTIILTPGNTTFISNQNNTYGLGLIERLLIGTLILILVAGLITLGVGPLWGMLLGLFVMGVWIWIGFWPWWAAGISFLVGFVLLAGRTD